MKPADFIEVNGHKVHKSLHPHLVILCKAAWADGVELIVDSGARTKEEQIQQRKNNIIDKGLEKRDPKEYERVIMFGDNGLFFPRTAAPGTSNHESMIAIDFRTKILSDGRGKGGYAWLVKNGHKFGWVRTVPSERWHWEYRPKEKNMFFKVDRDHETWDGLLAA